MDNEMLVITLIILITIVTVILNLRMKYYRAKGYVNSFKRFYNEFNKAKRLYRESGKNSEKFDLKWNSLDKSDCDDGGAEDE